MKLVGSIQQLCTAGWIMAALVLVTINGFGFLGLESEPLRGSTPAISSLRQKLARLESRLAENTKNAFGQYGFLEKPISMLTTKEAVEPSEASAESGSGISLTENVLLPDLTGILKADSPSGKTAYLALLDGRVCRETDEVMAFKVEKISAEGVLLSRQGMEWFVESPAPRYSSDQGQ